MTQFDSTRHPHRRKNLLTGEWILVSPHRTQRPWQGEVTPPAQDTRPKYDPSCYLCPGNKRANGDTNPAYTDTFVFTNDYAALLPTTPAGSRNDHGLLQLKSERGICRVVNFSPRHDLTLAEMSREEIEKVVAVWQQEYRTLAADPRINHVQIFENKGAMMGNSNPHPHCQIWAQEHLPMEASRELRQFTRHYRSTGQSLLAEYVKLERRLKERIVYENASFVALVPFWAVWPFETMIVSKRKLGSLLEFKKTETGEFADALRVMTAKYDNLFKTSFPYSSGLHQAPTDGKPHPEWHFHAHF
ncbi:MAG TPA: galactose-1-phosphate uridylyltransferase, partial [Bacteroidota bacterium]|nr:galactose-1-phosphate uridylyltransferase [Bacteroidota bacterium]